MNLQQFKAWFEGFTENISGAPNQAQWQRITERVSEIQETPARRRDFTDKYWDDLRPYIGDRITWTAPDTRVWDSSPAYISNRTTTLEATSKADVVPLMSLESSVSLGVRDAEDYANSDDLEVAECDFKTIGEAEFESLKK